MVERMIAFRYLRARQGEGFISIIGIFSLLGIALGVATLIIVMSVMNGFRAELLDRILGVNSHISVYAGQTGNLDDYEALTGQIRDMPHVTAAWPMVEGQVMVSREGQAGGAYVRGIRAEDLKKKPLILNNIVAGNADAFEGSDAILIGEALARQYGIGPGTKLTLISPEGHATPMGLVPRMKAYTVAGIFKVGMHEYDAGLILMPFEEAQIYFRQKEKASSISVMVDDLEQADDIARAIFTATEEQYFVQDWQRSNAQFFNAVQVERNVMFLILTLIIIVAAFNIIVTLIMLVKEKNRDIAILRTMGISRGSILRVFWLCGAMLGTTGTVLGVLLGLGFAANIESIRQWLEGLTNTELFAEEIYFLSQLPAIVDPVEVSVVTGMALGIAFLATLYPSWRAARTEPAEALRYE